MFVKIKEEKKKKKKKIEEVALLLNKNKIQRKGALPFDIKCIHFF
jgi:hypothetical protein